MQDDGVGDPCRTKGSQRSLGLLNGEKNLPATAGVGMNSTNQPRRSIPMAKTMSPLSQRNEEETGFGQIALVSVFDIEQVDVLTR